MNSNNIARFPGVTRLDIDPDLVLQEAVGKLEGVVVAGFNKDGGHYFASSYADGADALWLVEMFKKNLLEIADGD